MRPQQNSLEEQPTRDDHGAGRENFVEREERRARISSWRLALKAFSSSRAAFTAVSSAFRREVSSKAVSTLTEELPETGGRGVLVPYSEVDPSTKVYPHPIRVLLPISSIN